MRKKIITIVLVIAVLGIGTAFVLAQKNKQKAADINQQNSNLLPQQIAEPPPPTADQISLNPPAQQANPTPTPSQTATPAPVQKQDQTMPPAQQPAPTQTQTQPAPPPPAPTTKTESLSTTADDSVASPDTLTVNKGDTVNLTLNVKTTGVYYGGLDFRSSVFNSGTVLPGQNKTVSFTADQSFDIHCFWPSSNVEKAAVIHVVVK